MSDRAYQIVTLTIAVGLSCVLNACTETAGPVVPPKPGPPAKLAFTVQPRNTVAGVALNPAVVVTIEDSLGQVVTGATNVVTVVGGPLVPPADTGSQPLFGTTTVTAVKGLASFGNLSLQQAGTGYYLTATSPGLARAASATFAIAPAAPSQLSFVAQPGSMDSGAVIAPAIQVAIVDAFANAEPNATNPVTIALANNPNGAVLSGTTTTRALNGIATFTDLRIDGGGGGYTLTATTSGLAQATSASFNVRAPLALATVSAGGDYTCGITKAGSAYCWGGAAGGDLGDGDTTGRGSCPIRILGTLVVARVPCGPTAIGVSEHLAFGAVSAGGGQTCGFASNGAAYCWGRNDAGVLGSGATTGGPQSCIQQTGVSGWRFTPYTSWIPCSSLPLPVSGGLSFVTMSAGGGPHTCGLTPAGDAYCWGVNTSGQLGTGDTINRSEPVLVSGGLTFVAISAGGHTCGLTSTGAAYCWGYNGDGSLGDGTTTNRAAPVAVSGAISFAQISAGASITCGVTAAGSAYCWGTNADGALGDGTNTNSTTPVAVSGGVAFATVSAGGRHACGLTAAGGVYCWGYNGDGQLGNGTTTNSPAPVAVSGGIVFTGISAGGSHTCGVTASGAVYCWGFNRTGQLGNGTSGINSYSSVPVRAVRNP